MQFIDLSHPIKEGMPLYPGTPPVRITTLHTMEKDGFREKQIVFTTHSGTHVDVPGHIRKDGALLDQLPLEQFYGPCYVLDVHHFKGKEIPAAFLKEHRKAWHKAQFLLFHSAYDRLWGQAAYFENYPVLSQEAAALVAGEKHLKGLGFDTISPDPMNSTSFPIHRTLFKAGYVIIENLTNLRALVGRNFTLILFPLPVEKADGMPVRVVGLID